MFIPMFVQAYFFQVWNIIYSKTLLIAISVEFLLLSGFIFRRAVRGTDVALTSLYDYKGENINTFMPKSTGSQKPSGDYDPSFPGFINLSRSSEPMDQTGLMEL